MRRVAITSLVLVGAVSSLLLRPSAQGPQRRYGLDVHQVAGADAIAREALVKFRTTPRRPEVDALRRHRAGIDYALLPVSERSPRYC